jgi:hypothetical protein
MVAADPAFVGCLVGLSSIIGSAYRATAKLMGLGNTVPDGHPASLLLPKDYRQLTGELPADSSLLSKKSRAASKTSIHRLIGTRRRAQLRKQVVLDMVPATNFASPSEVAHVLAITSRSQASRVLQAQLGHARNRIPAADFVAWARWHLALPAQRVFGERAPVADVDHAVEVCCANHHSKQHKAHHLDAMGDHASDCPSGKYGTNYLHNSLKWTLTKFITDLGLEARSEPPTTELIGGKHPAQICDLAWPKRKTPAATKIAAELAAIFITLDTKPPSSAPFKTAMARYRELCAESAAEQGKRVDIHIVGNHSTDYLVDISSVQTTAPTYIKPTLALLTGEPPEAVGDPRAGLHLPTTPALIAREDTKRTHYRGIMGIAEREYAKKNRACKPIFLAPAFSHRGELSPDFFKLIEVITMTAKAAAVQHPPADGTKPSVYAARVRTDLKDAVACGIAKGQGRIMRTAGFPAHLNSGRSA